MANSIEIIKPFVKELGDAHDVQIFGGIGSAALADERTVIDVASKTIVAPASLYVSDVRENGSKKDVDVFVRTSDDDRIKDVEDILAATVGQGLEQSVFGFRTAEQVRAKLRHPLAFRAFWSLLSDRYEDQASGELTKVLFPFGVDIDPESLETWRLEVGDLAFNVPHPAMTIINYTQRSVGGIRAKDVKRISRPPSKSTLRYRK